MKERGAGGSPVAQSRALPDGRAHGFAALANIGVLRAGRAQPLYLLTPAGRFAAFGGNSPQGWRFPPVPGGRGVCAPGPKHFLSFWRKRPPQTDFFRQADPAGVRRRTAFFEKREQGATRLLRAGQREIPARRVSAGISRWKLFLRFQAYRRTISSSEARPLWKPFPLSITTSATLL